MTVGYQERDAEIVDYCLYRFDGIPTELRGPRVVDESTERFGVCLGAAQTFGCFVQDPYPALLSRHLDTPILNLGIAGAGPTYFVREAGILDVVNRADFAVIQVMSARGEENSMFASGDREVLTRRVDGISIGADDAYRELLDDRPVAEVEKLVEETRRAWQRSYAQLLTRIAVPTILLWFSRRRPKYDLNLSGPHELFGHFPQLVDEPMVWWIRGEADRYVECVTSRGMPQLLISRFTGAPTQIRGSAHDARPRTHNTYFPSPEMHADAAEALRHACAPFIRATAPE